jgi:hypothetical protein
MPNDPPRNTYVALPGDIAIFFDKRLPVAPGMETNNVAVVAGELGALYLGHRFFGRRVEKISLQELPSLPKVEFRRSVEFDGEKVASYFIKYADRPSYFEAGLRALHCYNQQPFLMSGLFPERPTYKNEEDYETAWEQFKSQLLPFDGIYTVDLSSRLSRFIAWATHGTWSHVALYIGDGEIHESVTSGLRRGPLELYKGRHYWIAAYRHIGAINSPRTADQARATVASLSFRPDRYNYRGAIKFGLKAFLNDHSHDLVPNSAMYMGNRVLIGQV